MNIYRFFCFQFTILTVVGWFLKVAFYYFNLERFIDLKLSKVIYALLWGINFDASIAAALALTSFLFHFFWEFSGKRICWSWSLFLTMAILVSLQIFDIMYFADSGRHLSYEIKSSLIDIYALFMTAIFEYSSISIFYLLLMLSSAWISYKLSPVRHYRSLRHGSYLKFVGVIIFGGFTIRGQLPPHLPLSTISAYEIGQPDLGAITINGAYYIIRSNFAKNKQKQINKIQTIDKNEQLKHIKKLYAGEKKIKIPGVSANTNYNVIFVLLESWPAAYMASYGYQRQTTPFFDALRNKSLTTKEMFAGGTRTSEGVFAIFCSYQNPLGISIVGSTIQDYSYQCLPSIFRKKGRKTAFFQGTHKNTSGVGSFAQKIGFEESYGIEDMRELKLPPHAWGAHDDDIYDFVLQYIENRTENIFIAINTNSTHGINSPSGFKGPFQTGNNRDSRDNNLYYADYALKRFVAKLKAIESLGPTLLILTADHTRGSYANRFDKFRIPFLIHILGNNFAFEHSNIATQRDIAPTILDLIGWKSSQSFAGLSLLRDYKYRFADYYASGVLGLAIGQQMIEVSIVNSDVINCYQFTPSLNERQKTKCKPSHLMIRDRALSYTTYSQDLLYLGRTKIFKKFQKQ